MFDINLYKEQTQHYLYLGFMFSIVSMMLFNLLRLLSASKRLLEVVAELCNNPLTLLF